MIAGTDARPPAKRRTAFLKARRWFRCCSFGVPVSVSLSFFAVRVAAEQVPGRRLPAAAPWDFRGYSFTARGLLVQCACSLIVAAAPTFGTAPADPCAGAAGSSGTFFCPAAFSSTPPPPTFAFPALSSLPPVPFGSRDAGDVAASELASATAVYSGRGGR